MIISLPVSIKKIHRLGRDFPWPRPGSCPVCHSGRLWGHGFVLAYFDDLPEGLWLRRYRCPLCGSVHRLKPEGYFRRFQASVSTIRGAIERRLITGRWPPGVCRVRYAQWLKNLSRQVMARLGRWYMGRLLCGFDRLIRLGAIPVTRSL
mgnify:CR=1 FL=1